MRTHVSRGRDPRARGLGFGHAHADAVEETAAHYLKAFAARGFDLDEVRRRGHGLGERLRVELPEIFEEIRGIADGAEIDRDVLLAVNARTELLGGAAECSLIGVLPERSGGPTILAQNWDWHPPLAASCVLWHVEQGDGRWLTTVTEAGMLAKAGLNDRGLAVGLNRLQTTADSGRIDGIPIHLMLRLALQDCDDLAAVGALVRGGGASASSCISVAQAATEDRAAEMACFEISPLGVHEVRPEAGVILHTNHFIAPFAGTVDINERDLPDTVERLEELRETVRDVPGQVDEDLVKAALSSHQGGPCGVCRHPLPGEDNETETLFSIVMRLEERSLDVAEGAPCDAPFESFAELTA